MHRTERRVGVWKGEGGRERGGKEEGEKVGRRDGEELCNR